jgi:uncharacterized FlaG/YvyC family protein
MDTGISHRSVSAPLVLPSRADMVPVRQAASTILPQPAQVVPAMEHAEKSSAWISDHARFMSEQDARTIDEIRERVEREREIEFDSAEKELIFRTIDASSGRIVSQTPNEAMLRLREFLKETGIVRSDYMPIAETGTAFETPQSATPAMSGGFDVLTSFPEASVSSYIPPDPAATAAPIVDSMA